jgi:hypothetical protein
VSATLAHQFIARPIHYAVQVGLFKRGLEAFLNPQVPEGVWWVTLGQLMLGPIYKSCVYVSIHITQQEARSWCSREMGRQSSVLNLYRDPPGGWSLCLIQRTTPGTFVFDHSPCGVQPGESRQGTVLSHVPHKWDTDIGCWSLLVFCFVSLKRHIEPVLAHAVRTTDGLFASVMGKEQVGLAFAQDKDHLGKQPRCEYL